MGCASPPSPVRARQTGSDAPGRASHLRHILWFCPPVLHAHSEACDRLGRRCVVGRVPCEADGFHEHDSWTGCLSSAM